MKNFLGTILFILCSLNSFEQVKNEDFNLFIKVSNQLKNDEKSFQVFQSLNKAYKFDIQRKSHTSDSLQDLYLELYNQGIPLVRLIKEDVFKETFKTMNNQILNLNNNKLRTNYNTIISSYTNFNNDSNLAGNGEQQAYFLKYLSEYLILPITE